MTDERLTRADARKLGELARIMVEQPQAERLHPIAMQAIDIGHGAAGRLCGAVSKLVPDARRVLLVTGPTEILDAAGRNVKEAAFAALCERFEAEWLMLREPEGLVHATPENAAKIQARLEGADCVVGLGSGTICDLCKYATYGQGRAAPLPLVIVQTALSVNAFSDDASVMLINGVKRTVHSRYPSILLIDLDIVSAAPPEMNVSGYGDLIATWTAPVDWYLANELGMGKNYHSAPSDMIRGQCEALLENSARLAGGDPAVLGDLANVLTLSGLSMGLAGESSPASGSEHVMSHLIDMTAAARGTGICYHGTQVAVSGILAGLVWDWLLNEFDPKQVELQRCYPGPEQMEPRVRQAFSWLSAETAEECWADYRKKLAAWQENRARFAAFLEGFDAFRERVRPWVKKPAYIAACMHRAGAPTRYSALNYPVDAATATWAVANCHLMRNRFSVIDLLHFAGIWDEGFVRQLLARADALDAGL